MQTILVLDVAAAESGALTILEEYYDRLRQDTENRYVFCVSLPKFEETETVKVVRYPWVKRSWLHRLWFEHVTVHRLMRREKIDRVFSLQNTVVSRTKKPQTVYLHQPLPFCGIPFSLFRQPRFWAYQHLIAPRIFRGLRVAEKVIVQTQWMKTAACEKTGIDPDKVVLESPAIHCVATESFEKSRWERTFFYPASAYAYKNHLCLFQAMERLAAEGITDYTVRLTLQAEQLPTIQAYPEAQKRVEWLGQIPRDAVMEGYASSALVFPSYIETFGLPLLEARMTGAPVIASDCPFSREILEGYEKAAFFDPFSPDALAKCMRDLLEESI